MAASAFLENVGRRVVLATLLLIFTLFLAMVLPSSGPLRQSQRLDVYWPTTQMAATGYSPVPAANFPPLPAVVDVEIPAAAFHW
ncbi:MAG: hypothetical protein ACRD10_14420 [Terriglobia bacterium]